MEGIGKTLELTYSDRFGGKETSRKDSICVQHSFYCDFFHVKAFSHIHLYVVMASEISDIQSKF